MKRYLFNVTLNTRDIGGYINKEGKEIKYLRFIRSDALHQIEKEDLDFLVENNILTQIDLRSVEVSNRYVSKLKLDSRFDYHLISINEGSMSSMIPGEDMSDLYMKIVNNHHAFYEIFKLFANTPNGIIYNCSAGKDRTGITTYLLLTLAGIDEETIIEDYEVSRPFIDERIGLMIKKVPTFPPYLGDSQRETLIGFIPKFKAKYGDIINYLHIVGITDDDINKILDKLFN